MPTQERLSTQLDVLKDRKFRADREIDHIMNAPYPRSTNRRQQSDFEDAKSAKVKEQYKIIDAAEETYKQIVEDYAHRFPVVREAIDCKRPLTAYTINIVNAAVEEAKQYRFPGKFYPQQFLKQFPRLEEFDELFDASWDKFDEEWDQDMQYVKGSIFEHARRPAKTAGIILGCAASVYTASWWPLTIFGAGWVAGALANETLGRARDVIEFPARGIHWRAEQLEQRLQTYRPNAPDSYRNII